MTAIAAGNIHSIALQSDGTLWAWGGDFAGQLGIGVVGQPYPAQVHGLGGVTTVDAGLGGPCRNLALKGDGTVWEWGSAASGLSANMSPAVVQVSDLSDDVQAISAAGWCKAVKRDGTVWAWGVPYGSASELAPAQIEGLDHVVAVSRVALRGDGTVAGLNLNRVVAVAAYWSYGFGNLALEDDGSVWQWAAVGEAERDEVWYFGPLALEPEQVDGLSGVVGIAGGDIATALKRDGTIWEWSDRATPSQRTGVNDVTTIAVGIGYSMALKRDGTIWTWGRTDRAPVQAPALSDVKAIAAGSINGSPLAVKRDGTVWTLSGGPDPLDPLAEEWIAIRTTPVAVVPLGAPDLSVAGSHGGDFRVGDEAIYNLTITNVGLTATSGMITVTDTLPPGVTWITATGSGWNCSAKDQVVTCMSPVQIGPGASSSIRLVVEVGSAAWPGVTNLAVVSNGSDRNGANNAGWDPTVVLQGK